MAGNSEVQAYVMDNGDVIDSSVIEKARMNNSSNLISTDIDEFGESYAAGLVYRPTLKLNNLKMFSSENPYHQRCIQQKAIDCCSGWKIATVDKYGNEVQTDSDKRGKSDNRLYSFFNECTVEDDLMELCKQFIIDYETFGFANLELTRNRVSEPSKLFHVESETVRIARNLNAYLDTDQKYMVQVVNAHERVFKIFNRTNYNKMIEPHNKNIMSEILYLRNYHVDGGKYGIPNWFPALKAMVGNDKVAEYNINYFDNQAIPRFAVIVTGGKLDEETKTKIRNYFKKDLKGNENAHKTLVLTTNKGAEVKLLPLNVDIKDGSFRFYKKDNRDEIVTAHAVPHHRLQVLDAGSSGTLSNTTIFQLDKTYKYSTIKPLQRKIQNLFNNIIYYGFGIKDKQFKLNDLDIGEEKEEAEIKKTTAGAHEKYYSIGAMNINEIRQDLKLLPFRKGEVDDDIYEWAITPRPVFLIREAQKQQEAQLNANSASGNLNETTNDFQDKSREQTQGNTQFSDKQLNNLMMKRNSVLDVLEKLEQELNMKDINLEDDVV